MARREDQLTTGEVAKVCGVAPRTVGKWIDSGALKGWRIPGSMDRRVPLRSLVAFMRENGMDVLSVPGWKGAGVVVTVGYVAGMLPDDCGFEVHHAKTVFDAGSAFATHRPDAVLVDTAIGRIDSILIARSVRPLSLCVAVGEVGVFDSFDAVIPPGLSPADKAERLRIVVEARDERVVRGRTRKAS